MNFEYTINLYGRKENGFVCPVAFHNNKFYIFEIHNNKVLRFVELPKYEVEKRELIKAETSREIEKGKRVAYGFSLNGKTYIYKIGEMANFLKKLDLSDSNPQFDYHTIDEINSLLSEYTALVRKKKALIKERQKDFEF